MAEETLRAEEVRQAHGPVGSTIHLVLRHRALVILPPVVLVIAVLVYSALVTPVYQGDSDVLLNRQNLAAELNNQTVIAMTSDVFFQMQKTQAQLAQSPAVASAVLAKARLSGMTPHQLLAKTTVTPDPSTDFLHFQVQSTSPERAAQLSRLFAQQYVTYRRELDTAPLQSALQQVHRAIATLPNRPGNRAVQESLTAKAQQLQTLEALQSGNAQYVNDNPSTSQVQPRTARDAIIALFVGLVLGLGAAGLRDFLDTRIRTPEEISEFLDLPLLGVIPPPPKPLASQRRPVMLDEPASPAAESFRVLAHSLRFANLQAKASVIMVTSAIEAEGKTTTASNLALALARAGQDVALVDLDLRKPMLQEVFGIDAPGITDVTLGLRALDEVGRRIDLDLPSKSSSRTLSPAGELTVYSSGSLPPNPGEFLVADELRSTLNAIRERHQAVVIDTSPLLRVGDPLTISNYADAMLLVARLGIIRRPMMRELSRIISGAPCPVLGFVLTGSAKWIQSYGYGYGYGYGSNGAGAQHDEVTVASPAGRS